MTITRQANVLTGHYPPGEEIILPTGRPAWKWRATVREGHRESMATALRVAAEIEAALGELAAARAVVAALDSPRDYYTMRSEFNALKAAVKKADEA